MTTRPFSNFMSSPDLAKLNRIAAAQRQLDARWQAVLPPELTGQSRVVGLDADCLVVSTRSAAVMTKIRQMEMRLVTTLSESGVKVNAIRCRIQVETLPHEGKISKRNLTLSDAALDAFENASHTVPNPLLREAFAQLVAKRRKTP